MENSKILQMLKDPSTAAFSFCAFFYERWGNQLRFTSKAILHLFLADHCNILQSSCFWKAEIDSITFMNPLCTMKKTCFSASVSKCTVPYYITLSTPVYFRQNTSIYCRITHEIIKKFRLLKKAKRLLKENRVNPIWHRLELL